MVLLFELHRHGWQLDSEQLHFHSCRSAAIGSDSNPEIDGTKLLRLIGYSQLIRWKLFFIDELDIIFAVQTLVV